MYPLPRVVRTLRPWVRARFELAGWNELHEIQPAAGSPVRAAFARNGVEDGGTILAQGVRVCVSTRLELAR